MNKGDFLAKVTEESGVARKDVDAVYNAFVTTIKEAVSNKEEVRLLGFASFGVKHKNARTAFNPRTREKIEVAEKDVPHFRALGDYEIK